MKKNEIQELQPEVLISCLDVLCRANATVFESDPKLASDISHAIESLTLALQSQCQPREEEITEVIGKEKTIKYVDDDHDQESIVDVLTNEIIYKPSSKKVR
ncbi:MAG: hypothetical protein V1706_11855 [Pseudomonadota bacterium]